LQIDDGLRVIGKRKRRRSSNGYARQNDALYCSQEYLNDRHAALSLKSMAPSFSPAREKNGAARMLSGWLAQGLLMRAASR